MRRLLPILGLLVLLPSQLLAASPSTIPTVEVVTLDNGLTLMLREDHSVPLVSVELRSRAGSILDPKTHSGLAELTATLLTYGTETRTEDEIADTLALLGGTLSAGAGPETFSVSGSVPTISPSAFEQWLELFIEVVRKPSFPEDAVKRVKRRRLSQLAGLKDNRRVLARRTLMQSLFGDHPYGRAASGTIKSVASILRQDIVNFHHTFFLPDDAVLGIAGDFNRNEVVDVLSRTLGRQEWGELCESPGNCKRTCRKEGGFCAQYARLSQAPYINPYPTLKTAALDTAQILLLDVDDPTLNQAQIRLGNVLGVDYTAPEWMAYYVGAQVLGGDFNARLNQELRVKRGLTYGARWVTQPDDIASGAAYAATYTNPKNVVGALRTILNELSRFHKEPPTQAELARVKNRLTNGFVFRFETPGKVLSQYMDLWQEQLPVTRLQSYKQRVRNVSHDDIRKVSQLVPTTQWVAVVVANASLLPELQEFASTIGATVRVVQVDWLGLAAER